MTQNVLVGKTIIEVQLAGDSMAVKFVLDGGANVIASSYADCCSHTWVEHIEMPALGLPALVVGVESLGAVKEDSEVEGGCIRFYGTKIITDRGEIFIDYRNSSNGYYGGSLTWPGDYNYDGEQYDDNQNWRKV